MAGNTATKRVSSNTRATISTKTPILLRFTENEGYLLKLPPYFALENIRNNNISVKDIETLRFRILVGVHLASIYYTKRTEEEIKKTLSLLRGNKISFSEEEINLILNGLIAVDKIQDQCTRKQILDAFKAVQEKTINCLP